MKQTLTDQITMRDITMDNPARFVNREFSWLQFNNRVLMEAANSKNPLLERVQFFSISATNLDEFFMVRVAGLAAQIRSGITECSADGRTPQEQLDFVLTEIAYLQANQQQELRTLRYELKQNNIEIVCSDKLSKVEKLWLERYFLKEVFPVLAPSLIDSIHSFPFIPNLGFSLAFQLLRRVDQHSIIVFLPVPNTLKRFILLPQEENNFRFILLEDLVCLFIDRLFPGYDNNGAGTFRIIRDSDIEVEEEAEDLVHFFETALKKRRRGEVIRIEFNMKMPENLRQFITDALRVPSNCVSVINGLLALNMISEIVSIPRDDLKFISHSPRIPECIREHGGDCFAAIRERDIVIHHPYETIHAAERGKTVTALVELKARFDEEANIRWARDLECAGVQVIFGFVELKTHAKMSLVVRYEENCRRFYVHLGTGNYHPITAKMYTDLSFFTTDDDIAHDVRLLFNYLTE